MKPISVGKNTVSVIAIMALTLLGVGWAYMGVGRMLYVAIMVTVAIAGLGGYSIAKGDIPFPGDGGGQ